MERKDLRAGKYYKGYGGPPPSRKLFVYVASVSITANGEIQVEAESYDRKVRGAWSAPVTTVGDAHQPTFMRREATLQEVLAEAGVHAPSAALNLMAAVSVRLSEPVKKERIPENAKSSVCVRCGGENKQVTLLLFSSYYCPKCEPT